jgi:lysophospholipase L1-like esterase
VIQNIDYAPTFLELAGAKVPSEIQGQSMVDLWKNQGKPSAAWRDAIYYAYYENAAVHNVPVHDGVRTERYKLMFFPRTREWNLFDLQEDPHEMQSVHDSAAYQRILSGMKQRYLDLRQIYDVNSAVIPATRGDEPNWKKRDQQLTRRASNSNADLAFIGDSITQGWEGAGKDVWDKYYRDRNAINLGIGGDRTEHVIWRLTHRQLNKIKPKVAVLLIGTNNTGHFDQDPDEVSEGVGRILEIIKNRSPDTKIIMHGIFPRGEDKFDPKRLNNIAINQRIKRFADGQRVHYLEIGDHFLEEDGTISNKIMPDQLHLSPEGYEIWASALEPKLTELGL